MKAGCVGYFFWKARKLCKVYKVVTIFITPWVVEATQMFP